MWASSFQLCHLFYKWTKETSWSLQQCDKFVINIKRNFNSHEIQQKTPLLWNHTSILVKDTRTNTPPHIYRYATWHNYCTDNWDHKHKSLKMSTPTTKTTILGMYLLGNIAKQRKSDSYGVVDTVSKGWMTKKKQEKNGYGWAEHVHSNSTCRGKHKSLCCQFTKGKREHNSYSRKAPVFQRKQHGCTMRCTCKSKTVFSGCTYITGMAKDSTVPLPTCSYLVWYPYAPDNQWRPKHARTVKNGVITTEAGQDHGVCCILMQLTLLQHLRAGPSIPSGHPVADATQPRHSLSSASSFNFYTYAPRSTDVTG